MSRALVEICVEDLEGIGIARAAGADRVEYCRDISCGGLTPEPGTITEALSLAPGGGLQVLVRSRPGGFVYDGAEIETMCEEIRLIRAAHDARLRSRGGTASPRLGFVVGALTPAALVDELAAARFREAAGPHGLTFHRAFDAVRDRRAALEVLVDLGFERVLTTGGSAAVADLDGLAALVRQGGRRIAILASGGLRSGGVADAISATGAREVHMRAPSHGSARTDPAETRRIVAAVRGAGA